MLEQRRNSLKGYINDIVDQLTTVGNQDEKVVFCIDWRQEIKVFQSEAERLGNVMYCENNKEVFARTDKLEETMNLKNNAIMETLLNLAKQISDPIANFPPLSQQLAPPPSSG